MAASERANHFLFFHPLPRTPCSSAAFNSLFSNYPLILRAPFSPRLPMNAIKCLYRRPVCEWIFYRENSRSSHFPVLDFLLALALLASFLAAFAQIYSCSDFASVLFHFTFSSYLLYCSFLLLSLVYSREKIFRQVHYEEILLITGSPLFSPPH